MITPMVAGNWKMNGLKGAASEITSLIVGVTATPPSCDVLVCPPATLLAPFAALAASTPLKLGGQDCHANATGANTGDIAAEMLRDAGADYVIVGHSERRTDHKERDSDVRAKAEAGWRAGLKVILCIGERLGERDAGLTLDVIRRQLTNSLPEAATAVNLLIAYEPVWAIGTGLTPTVDQVGQVHGFIRQHLIDHLGEEEGGNMRILYGGSVKPENAAELMAVSHVNGALVGGASLKATDFLGIIAAYNELG